MAVLPIIRDTRGDAVVEAAILFPIMIMIFAALVLLAIYLPIQAALQQATQYAATTLAVEKSDTWLRFDESSMSYYWETDKNQLPGIYAALFSGIDDMESRSEDIVIDIENRGISSKAGELAVECYIVNQLVHKEVVVTAAREFAIPINLSIIGFPESMTIKVTSTAVVQNGDEFIRNIDMAVDFIEYISAKFGLTDIGGTISSYWGTVASIFGW